MEESKDCYVDVYVLFRRRRKTEKEKVEKVWRRNFFVEEKKKEENIWRREIFHLRRRERTEKKKEEMLWRRKFDGDANQQIGRI